MKKKRIVFTSEPCGFTNPNWRIGLYIETGCKHCKLIKIYESVVTFDANCSVEAYKKRQKIENIIKDKSKATALLESTNEDEDIKAIVEIILQVLPDEEIIVTGYIPPKCFKKPEDVHRASLIL